jgi:hypothetical protein
MKRQLSELELKHIHELLKMDEQSLKAMLLTSYALKGPQYSSDDLSAFLSKLFYSLGLDFWRKDNEDFSPSYPPIYADSRLDDYFFDLQQVLCANGWLCSILHSEELTFEEKADLLTSAVVDRVHAKRRWAFRFDPFAVAVLITKIGGRRMCGCPDE